MIQCKYNYKCHSMPKKGYKQTDEHKNSIGKNFEKHKLDCQCCFCKAKRGEHKGKNHPQAVKKIPFVCQRCGKVKYVYPRYAKRAKYCSTFCAHIGKPSGALGKHWKVKDTSKYKGSKKGRRFKIKNPSTKKRVTSEETKQKLRERRINNPIKKFSNTSIEIKIKEELEKRGFIKNKDFFQNKGMFNIANVDFYLPKYNTVIECDGCYWHGCKTCGFVKHHKFRRVNDIRNTLLLREMNIETYRFWEHEINSSASECINKIFKKQ